MDFYRERLIPLSHLGRLQDAAGALVFLASDDALLMTGHTLVIDGGQTSGDGRKLKAYPPEWTADDTSRGFFKGLARTLRGQIDGWYTDYFPIFMDGQNPTYNRANVPFNAGYNPR